MTDDEAAQIELLTVGLVGSPDMITNHAIAEYNRTSENIRLRVVNYAPVVDDDGGYHSSSALDAFELDIVAGRIPDIMIIEADTGAKLSRLAGDRLFCDLYELMDKNGFDKSGLLSGITSYELVEGQSDEPSLYYFPLEVSISTFVGRSSEFSEPADAFRISRPARASRRRTVSCRLSAVSIRAPLLARGVHRL